MGLVSTVVIMGLSLSLFATAMIVNRRPAMPGRPRMIPWVGVQMVCILVTVVMFAHLISLMTGHPLVGRQGY
jgi:hypothetical protein